MDFYVVYSLPVVSCIFYTQKRMNNVSYPPKTSRGRHTLPPSCKTFLFPKNEFGDFTKLFSESFFHIGCDEDNANVLAKDLTAQKPMRQHRWKSLQHIHVYFKVILTRFLDSKCRRISGAAASRHLFYQLLSRKLALVELCWTPLKEKQYSSFAVVSFGHARTPSQTDSA